MMDESKNIRVLLPMKRIFILLLCLLGSLKSYATALQDAADKLINRIDPGINIGISVVDLITGAAVYQRNANQLFVPASNMKLFSDAAAIMVLGPDYRFRTQLSTDASTLDQGVLKGSVYIHLTGDPSLTGADVKELLSVLSQWGVRRIAGNIVLVSSHSKVSPYAPGWADKDLKYSYGAPLAPLMLDENRLTVTVNPSHKLGEPAIVEFAHPYAMLLDNQVKTSSNPHCGVDFIMDRENKLTVRGCVALSQWAIQQRIAIRNPLRYAQALIKQQLIDLHIGLDGNVQLGNDKHSLVLATHESKPIAQLLADTLKPSDNLYADSLFLHAAEKLNNSPVDWQAAQPIVKDFLQQQTGINLQNAVLIDGSGLSRKDLLTPQQTVSLLRFLHEKFSFSYEYIAALPVAGRDGTLQRRLRLPSQQGFIRAKTGTMAGIIGLSGYLYTVNAHTLAFAIFINRTSHSHPTMSYRSLVDALCTVFLRQEPSNRSYVPATNAHARLPFQEHLTQAERMHQQKAKWRRLEASLKRNLQGSSVTVLFRDEQLILNDRNADPNIVWTALQTLRKKYAFAIALDSTSASFGAASAPFLLWIKSDSKNGQRTWKICEAVG